MTLKDSLEVIRKYDNTFTPSESQDIFYYCQDIVFNDTTTGPIATKLELIALYLNRLEKRIVT